MNLFFVWLNGLGKHIVLDVQQDHDFVIPATSKPQGIIETQVS